MSDLFHPDVPDEFISKVWGTMSLTPRHSYQILTKRPERMAQVVPLLADEHRPPSGYNWPLSNIWLMTSAEDQPTLDERLVHLINTPAAVWGVSLEPLLGPIDFGDDFWESGNRLDWVVVGGESGPKARPMHPDWVRSVRDQCVAAGVPFLFKQWGACILGSTWKSDFIPRGTSRFLDEGGTEWMRVGKKAAGRELDGRVWDQYPQEPNKGAE